MHWLLLDTAAYCRLALIGACRGHKKDSSMFHGAYRTERTLPGFSHLRHSYTAGLTLRAGAFPMLQLMFAWGGSEGHHNIFNMNSSLLGGSARPALD